MTRHPHIAAVVLLAALGFGHEAAGARIEGPAAAIELAKKYTGGRCSRETPCTFRPEREGKQWRVWVQLTKREAPDRRPRPAGRIVLFFDLDGNLIRRLETD